MLEKELNKGDFERNINNCHSRCCRPQDSGISTASNSTQGGYPQLQASGMTANFNAPSTGVRGIFKEEALNKDTFRAPLRSGFTLIELLVVVLIIGILAAVALPQYQVAVAKSRVAAYLPMMKSIAQTEEAYYLMYGKYARLDQAANSLDIEMPTQCRRMKSETNQWICGDFFRFDFSNSTLIRLMYCPGYNQAQDTCLGQGAFEIRKIYDYSDTSTVSHKGKWNCIVNNSSTLGQKVCNSLNF